MSAADTTPHDEPETDPSPEVGPEPPKTSKLRLVALAALLIGLFVAAKLLRLDERVSLDAVREMVRSAGGWGYVVFLVVFAIGELMHVPGVVFVFAAVLVYGQVEGGVLGFVGAVGSVVFSFIVVRFVGGQALAAIEKPWVKKVLSHLDERPIRTITMLRLVLWMAPPLNYALALSSIHIRDYVIGSVLGLAPVILVMVIFSEQLIRLFLG